MTASLFQRVISKSRVQFPAARAIWALPLTIFLLPACASSSAAPAPAWPEQPSPSYPDPSATAEKSDALTDESLVEPKIEAESDRASALAKQYDGREPLDTLKGKASYYADSLAGNHTASGEIYDPKLFTAAHKKLTFGTIVRVVREDNGAVTYAKINDRGPFGDAERILDLSKAAAKKLGMTEIGVASVRVEIVELPKE